MPNDEQHGRLEVASSVLRAVLATLAKHEPRPDFVILPELVPISSLAVTERLRRESKPIVVVALPYGTTIAVGWWPMNAEDAADHRSLMAGLLDDLTSPSLLKERPLKQDRDRETGCVLRFSLSQLRDFLLNFHLPWAEYDIRPTQPRMPSPEVEFEVRVFPSSFGTITGAERPE